MAASIDKCYPIGKTLCRSNYAHQDVFNTEISDGGYVGVYAAKQSDPVTNVVWLTEQFKLFYQKLCHTLWNAFKKPIPLTMTNWLVSSMLVMMSRRLTSVSVVDAMDWNVDWSEKPRDAKGWHTPGCRLVVNSAFYHSIGPLRRIRMGWMRTAPITWWLSTNIVMVCHTVGVLPVLQSVV